MRYLIFFVSLVLLSFQSLYAQKQGQARIDSLLQEIEPGKLDTLQAKVLLNLSFTYNTIDPDKGIEYGKHALAMTRKLGWTRGEANAYRAIGVNHGFGKSEFPESLSAFSKSLVIAETIGFKEEVAKSLNNIGVIYWYLSDYPKAIEHYFRALKVHEELGKKDEMAINLTNIGIIYFNQGDFPKALEYLLQGNALDEELQNKPGIASNYGNIGQVYANMGDLDKALYYDSSSLAIYKELGDKNGIARNLANIGGLYSEKGMHLEALKHYKESLAIGRELDVQIVIASDLGSIGSTYFKITKDNDRTALQTLFNGDVDEALQQAEIYTDSAIVISKEIGDLNGLKILYERLSEIQTKMGDYTSALESYKQFSIHKDSIVNVEKNKKLTEAAMQYEFDKKEALAKAEQLQKDIRTRTVRNFILAGLIGALIFAGVVIRQRIRISREKKISDAERKRSDELLLNILPGEVADELKSTGSAKAKSFDMVTVMFTDFKDFTRISEKVSAELLVVEIHHCFSAFDHIIQKYNIEKIKTIGDAYLCASGLPAASDYHAHEIVHAAIEIRDFIERRKAEKKARGEFSFDIRIGIHTGPVVAGIVGVKKYAYDIWGDTVNLAARMEQNSEVGKINISENTYELVKDAFDCTYRGEIQAKNKGMVHMFFAEPLKEGSTGKIDLAILSNQN